MASTPRLRAFGAACLLVGLVMAQPAFAASRLLADALPPNHASCHARVIPQAERNDPERRIVSLAIERNAQHIASEKKWATYEQFDDTPIVSATLRVRFKNDPATHTARLACVGGDDGALVCTTPACAGGEIRILGEGVAGLAIAVGGKLKNGRFIRHYLHLDDSCEARSLVVLEAAGDEKAYSLASAPKEACR